MREICTSGSEGGGARNQLAPPTPIINHRSAYSTDTPRGQEEHLWSRSEEHLCISSLIARRLCPKPCPIFELRTQIPVALPHNPAILPGKPRNTP
jgi:hypothetical protein